jgi:glycosyltransferase involved in cell wall biosynthesis
VFDLVLATVDRVAELGRFLDSLERQTYGEFRVLLVDQNEDDRLAPLLQERGSLDITHLRSPRGLSRARNTALGQLRADFVAFPDDDCVYPDDLLERVAGRFSSALDGVTGRGGTSAAWAPDGAILTRDNLWNRAVSYSIFLRREVVERVGPFDERLGLPSSSGEEIDYLVRALDAGARIDYDPSIVIEHEEESRDRYRVATRDGKSIGYILRKHRYPTLMRIRMFVRPVGGALLALAHADRAGASFQLATLRGRLAGVRGHV